MDKFKVEFHCIQLYIDDRSGVRHIIPHPTLSLLKELAEMYMWERIWVYLKIN